MLLKAGHNCTKYSITISSSADALRSAPPDDKNVAFLSNHDGGFDVWYVSISGGEAQKMFDADPGWGGLRGDGWADEKLSWGN